MNENSNENPAELEKRYRTTVFIVLAQIFVVLFLIFVSWVGFFRVQNNLSGQDFTTLWIGLLFIAIGSFILRRLFFSWERLKNIGLLKGVSGLLGTLQMNSILLGMMAVIIGIVGFLIAAFSGSSSDMLRAGVIALVVFLINFPRKKIWKTIVSHLGNN